MITIQIKITGFDCKLDELEFNKTYETNFSLDNILDFIREFKEVFDKDYDKEYGYFLNYEEIMFKLVNADVYHEIYTTLKIYDLEWLKNIEFTYNIKLVDEDNKF